MRRHRCAMLRAPMARVASRQSDTRSPLLVGGGLTLAAWLITRLTVGAVLASSRNPLRLDVAEWFHWDSRNYLVIATQGRNFGRCGSPGFPAAIPSKNPGWCGTAGWLPGYPWMMRLVHLTGLSYPRAGILVSWVALRGRPVPRLVGLGPGPHDREGVRRPPPVRALPRRRVQLRGVPHVARPGAHRRGPAGRHTGTVPRRRTAHVGGRALLPVRVVRGHRPRGRSRPRGPPPRRGYGRPTRRLGTAGARRPGGARRPSTRLCSAGPTPTYWSRSTRASSPHPSPARRWSGIRPPGADSPSAHRHPCRLRRRRGDRRGLGAGTTPDHPGLPGVGRRGRDSRHPLRRGGHAGAWNRSVVLAAPSVLCLRRWPILVLVVLVVVVGAITTLVSQYFFNNTLV